MSYLKLQEGFQQSFKTILLVIVITKTFSLKSNDPKGHGYTDKEGRLWEGRSKHTYMYSSQHGPFVSDCFSWCGMKISLTESCKKSRDTII